MMNGSGTSETQSATNDLAEGPDIGPRCREGKPMEGKSKRKKNKKETPPRKKKKKRPQNKQTNLSCEPNLYRDREKRNP